MCCLFGILDYGHKLSRKEKTKILSVLSVACEERGTDATGIAYNSGGSLKVYKRPLPAHLLWFKVYEDTNLVMGHTRMTTQGSERYNQNNHPFSGQAGNTSFALAHNGVLSNDKRLRRQYDLPPDQDRNRFLHRSTAPRSIRGAVFCFSGLDGRETGGFLYHQRDDRSG